MQNSINTHLHQCLIFIGLLILVNDTLYAAGVSKSEFIYRSPEDRREAGLKTELTDWLTFSGLVEVERVKESLVYVDDIPDMDINSDIETLQLGFDIEISNNIEAVTIFEFEIDEENKSQTVLEEAVLIIDLDEIEIEMGRQTLPFGEYYSHFITDPILIIGEKLDNSIIVSFEIGDNAEIAAFASDGKAGKPDDNTRDWGANIELHNEKESIKLAIGYLSDLADTDESLLQDFNHIYQTRVPALNVNILMGFKNYEFTAEYLTALDKFTELDSEFNKPSSINIEVAYFPIESIQIALRAETSDELEDAPEKKYGISSTFVFARSMTFSVEYLTGRFKKGLAFDDDDNEFDKINTFAMQFSLAF